jgi:hypothetical protein
MINRIVIFALILFFTPFLSLAVTDAQTVENRAKAPSIGTINTIKKPMEENKGTIKTAPIPKIDIRQLTTTETAPATVCSETTKFSGGTVTTDRTLTKACSPYTISTDIEVDGNATLTIEPGVTLHFNPDTKFSIGYNGPAKLVAVGTAADPIVLTSSNSSPGAGDWVGVQLWSSTMNGTKLGYLKLDYCGSNSDACLLGTGVKANRVTVDHVTFSHVGSGSNAIWEKDRDSNFAISSCTFNDILSTPTQQYAISVYASSFHGIDSTNAFNGSMVEVMGGDVSFNTTWKNIGAVIAVVDTINIDGITMPTLTVAAGNTFKFSTDADISIGYNNPGKLVLAGTATSKITLTSLAFPPNPGDWNGITLWNNSRADIVYSTISYAGSVSGAVSVTSNSGALSIQNSTISHSGAYGIGVPCNSTATITNTGNTFESNAKSEVGPGPNGPDCQ